MRLVNMDVDRYGTNERCQLGNFSPGLNAICGPAGTGKSTLVRWVKDLVTDGLFESTALHPNSAYMDAERRFPATGSVEIHNASERFLVANDRNGRVKLESLSDFAPTRVLHRIPLSESQRTAFMGLHDAYGAADTEIALEQLATRLGLNTIRTQVTDRRPELLARERELENKLSQVTQLRGRREELLSLRTRLETELNTIRHGSGLRYNGLSVEHRRVGDRMKIIEQDLNDTLKHIEQLDAEIAAKSAELKLADGSVPSIRQSYREQLQELDDRLNRWRQTLRDLRTHRESIEYNATDARLDKELGDQLASSKDADPRAAMRSLEAQIINTRAQLDLLVNRYSQGYPPENTPLGPEVLQRGAVYTPPDSSRVYHDSSGRTYIGAAELTAESTLLPETLRSMQKDLHEVCQQLARYEAESSTDALKQQAQQLQRCEDELLQAVEKLIEERAQLLRRIANEHHISVEQLTLAFGNWCQCHDHPHLQDWLLSEESTCEKNSYGELQKDRPTLLNELEDLKRTRKQATLKADDCRRQLRDGDQHRSSTYDLKPQHNGLRDESVVRRELETVLDDLATIDSQDRLVAELEGVRHDLRNLMPQVESNNSFQTATDRFIAALMPVASSAIRNEAARKYFYDLVDGNQPLVHHVAEFRREVPSSLVRMAMRLAIGEAMRLRGEPVSLVFDDSLDRLPTEIQQSALSFLAAHARNESQQVIVLTADERVADMVRNLDGWSGYMHTSHTHREHVAPDVNQHLNALANDLEGQKWSGDKASSSDYYLKESSLIEDLPSIDPEAAARCRAVGIDRIGDLLDVDPRWLAEKMRMDGVSHGTVVRWQAVARLLCSVRKLRPFDARVLVGAGIRSPKQLATTSPGELMDKVEQFLTTDRGRRILRTGSSGELSRITSWIAAAKGSSSRYERSSTMYSDGSERDFDTRERTTRRTTRTYRSSDGAGRSRSSSRRSSSSRREYDRGNREYARGERESSSRGSRSTRTTRTTRRTRDLNGEYTVVSSSKSNGDSSSRSSSESEFKFYLELSSPVVDAPTIGPRMATRLEELGIYTVEDLLNADADQIAEGLDLKRVDADEVMAWQAQANLVCRIPNLRGHDAQLLVACDYTSPEELANLSPESVLAPVLEIARSKEGQRILRGGKEPDLEEVQDWINWAASCRVLKAA